MERTSNSVSKSGVGSLDFEPLQRSEIDLFMGSGSSSFETQHGKKNLFFSFTGCGVVCVVLTVSNLFACCVLKKLESLSKQTAFYLKRVRMGNDSSKVNFLSLANRPLRSVYAE